MYWPQVKELRQFYATPLGCLVARRIRAEIQGIWPEISVGVKLTSPEHIAGIGFTTPLMVPFLNNNVNNAYYLSAVMPESQGVVHWPGDRKNAAVCADILSLPFDDAILDRVLLCHVLEHSRQPDILLREIWRVLKPEGKLVVVVPNRTGPWCRAEHTPFGHGRPFSPRQLEQLLAEAMFSPQSTQTALFLPPVKSRAMLRFTAPWEYVSKHWLRLLGGVVIAHAHKQLYAGTLVTDHVKQATFATAID